MIYLDEAYYILIDLNAIFPLIVYCSTKHVIKFPPINKFYNEKEISFVSVKILYKYKTFCSASSTHYGLVNFLSSKILYPIILIYTPFENANYEKEIKYNAFYCPLKIKI